MRRHGSYAGRSILDSMSPPFADARSRLWPSSRIKIAMLFTPVLDSFDQPDLDIGCKEPA
jgi:hypothetical protein